MEALDLDAVAFLLVLEDVSSGFGSRSSSPRQQNGDIVDRTATMGDEAQRLRVNEDTELALGQSGAVSEKGAIAQPLERSVDASSRLAANDRDARGGSIEQPDASTSVEHARMSSAVLDAKQETRFANPPNDLTSKEGSPNRAAPIQSSTSLDGSYYQGRGGGESEMIDESRPAPQQQPDGLPLAKHKGRSGEFEMAADRPAPSRLPNGSLVTGDAGSKSESKPGVDILIDSSERPVGAEDARLHNGGSMPGQGSGGFAPLDSRGGLRSRFDRKALNRRAERLLDHERRLEELERMSTVRLPISSSGASSDSDAQLLFPL